MEDRGWRIAGEGGARLGYSGDRAGRCLVFGGHPQHVLNDVFGNCLLTTDN
jgi:hypothetical protein